MSVAVVQRESRTKTQVPFKTSNLYPNHADFFSKD